MHLALTGLLFVGHRVVMWIVELMYRGGLGLWLCGQFSDVFSVFSR